MRETHTYFEENVFDRKITKKRLTQSMKTWVILYILNDQDCGTCIILVEDEGNL